MLSQTHEQKVELSKQIAHVMETLIPRHVETQIAIHGPSLEHKLGLTEDDLMNDMREQVWKALISFDVAGGANLKTYVKKLIDNKFKSLRHQAGIKKYNLIEYRVDQSNQDVEVMVDENTGETLYELHEKRSQYEKFLSSLEGLDKTVYNDLLQGYDLAEMSKRTGQSKLSVTQAINRIDSIVKLIGGNT